MMERGSIWWVDLGDVQDATGHRSAKRRPVLVIQADSFNRSRLPTVTVATVTTNLRGAGFPGNVMLRAEASGLPTDSTANLTQLLTLNRWELVERIGAVDYGTMRRVDEGIRTVLGV
ncbi:MAG: type II toxin-antitoxin system PemK/MazF family toxin [Propionibacteriaceae bacterium]|jgi:mRNA interferase MazF|nr:type II toxin-antitoxin system PemK/MazF family toxin [Propionibacteriaceae bacterium]